MVKYETLVLGELQTNCYIVWDVDSKEGLVIDPADDGVGISEALTTKGINPKGILLTHGHFDHLLGALDLKLIYNIPLFCSQKDEFFLKNTAKSAAWWLKKPIEVPNIKKIDVDLDKTKTINLGQSLIKVIKTPGHTPGGVCFYLAKEGWLFSGDTLFFEARGRTDLKYGNTGEIFKSLKKLCNLPEETVVLPGHGQETTIGHEAARLRL